MDLITIAGLLARHLLTKFSGVLITHGLMKDDPSSTESLVGAGMFFAGIGWSAWQKYGRVMVDARLATAKGLHPDAIKAP